MSEEKFHKPGKFDPMCPGCQRLRLVKELDIVRDSDTAKYCILTKLEVQSLIAFIDHWFEEVDDDEGTVTESDRS